MSDTLGNDYGLTLNKLVNRKKTEVAYTKDENRTYFCSELIAKAFKLAGVIQSDDIPSTKFFPVNFSEEGQNFLKLTPNTILHREQEIILSADSAGINEQNDSEHSDTDQFF